MRSSPPHGKKVAADEKRPCSSPGGGKPAGSTASRKKGEESGKKNFHPGRGTDFTSDLQRSNLPRGEGKGDAHRKQRAVRQGRKWSIK